MKLCDCINKLGYDTELEIDSLLVTCRNCKKVFTFYIKED